MEHAIYLDGIKKALKARSINYSDLALSLKMTESGVKKMLNAKDISFQRILKICKVIDVLPGQLFSMSEKISIPTLSLSEKQQDTLMKDRHLLTVYWLLTIEKKTFEEILLIQKTTRHELKHNLQKLVTLDLITQKRNQYTAKHQGKFRWADDSKLAKILNQEWSQLTLKRALRLKNDEAGLHRFSALKLSNESYLQFVHKLSEILVEVAQISEREEMTLQSNKLIDFTLLIACAKGSVFGEN